MTSLYVPIILGTAREGRNSEKVAHYVYGEVKKRGEVETELLDVRDFCLPATDNTESSETAKRFAEKVKRADGFVIVSPEYNHGYPGELKMMLDMLYKDYNHKPVAFCGVSMGGLGGARLVEQLCLVALALKMVPVYDSVYFSLAHKLFDAEGKILDPSFDKRIGTMMEELLWYAKALKSARDSVSP